MSEGGTRSSRGRGSSRFFTFKGSGSLVFRSFFRWIPLAVVVFMVVSLGTYFSVRAIKGTVVVPAVDLVGSGSFFASELLRGMCLSYTGTPQNTTRVEYNPQGSDKGMDDLINDDVDFAVSDSSPESSTLKEADLQILPFAGGAEAVIYNFNTSQSDNSLRVSRSALVSIYLGEITRWDDEEIQQANPNKTLPHEQIIPFHRTEESLLDISPNLFLTTLCSFDPVRWKFCHASSMLLWPVSNPPSWRFLQTDGAMLTAVENTPFSIGYISLYAIPSSSISAVASLQNKHGDYIIPNLSTLEAAVAQAQLSKEYPVQSITDINCSLCWPISSFVYLIYSQNDLYRECVTARQMSQFFSWMYSSQAGSIKNTYAFASLTEVASEIMLDLISSESQNCGVSQQIVSNFTFSIVVGGAVTAFLLCIVVVYAVARKKISKPLQLEAKENLLSSPVVGSDTFDYGRSPQGSVNYDTEFFKESIKIHDDELTVGKMIGKGTFSCVYSGVWRGTNVAIKKVNISTAAKFSETIDVDKEIQLTSSFRHPNVVLMLGASISSNHMWIITEYCSRGSLYDIIHSDISLEWERQLSMAIDAARGMLYLHERNPKVIHRDLKTSNLLVDNGWNCKVGDFGISTVLADNQRMMTGNMGTVEYMAPECLKNEKYTEKCDVYSFGVVMCELFSRDELYKEMSVVQIRFLVRTQSLRPELPNYIPVAVKTLIEVCWDTDPAVRPSFSEILSTLLSFHTDPKTLTNSAILPKKSKKSPHKAVNRKTVHILSSSEKDSLWPHDSI